LINYFKSYSSLGDDRFLCVTLYLPAFFGALLSLKESTVENLCWNEKFCAKMQESCFK